MSSGQDNRRRHERLDSLIGEQTVIRGDLLFAGGLHVDGSVKGSVVALNDGDSTLVVSERGLIEGEVRVPHVTIDGVVIGDVYALDSVELAAQARISGNVFYRRLEVAVGAEVNGRLIHLEEAGLPQTPAGQEIEGPIGRKS